MIGLDDCKDGRDCREYGGYDLLAGGGQAWGECHSLHDSIQNFNLFTSIDMMSFSLKITWSMVFFLDKPPSVVYVGLNGKPCPPPAFDRA